LKRPTPAPASGLVGVAQVGAGEYHSMVVRTDGTVAGWGDNEYGQATNAVGIDDDVLVPTPVLGLANVVEVALGDEHSLALLPNGTVMAWGENSVGQLGQGTTTGPELCDGTPCSLQPIPVPGLANVIAISAHSENNLALLADGTVVGWGLDEYGGLGGGVAAATACKCIDHPVAVPGVSGAVAISMGNDHALALLDDGTVRAWGHNPWGQLGNGTAAATGCECLSTVAVSGISNAKEIGTGIYHSIAALGDGTVRTWGDNTYGDLGLGSAAGPETCRGFACSTVPVPVPGLAGATTVGAGYYFSHALSPAASSRARASTPTAKSAMAPKSSATRRRWRSGSPAPVPSRTPKTRCSRSSALRRRSTSPSRGPVRVGSGPWASSARPRTAPSGSPRD
jgi:alpha-tubulin suppressor-like RCC1 family protein